MGVSVEVFIGALSAFLLVETVRSGISRMATLYEVSRSKSPVLFWAHVAFYVFITGAMIALVLG